MAFTVEDVQDLIRLLAERPEWRAQLRPLILGDEFDRLPRIVEELAEAQRRTEQRVEELAEAQRRTEQRVEELAEAQRRTEQRVEELTVRMDQLTERMDRVEAQIADLVRATEALRGETERAHRRLDAELGYLYEMRFERRAPSLFGAWLRKPRVISLSDLDLVDQAEDAGVLTERDMAELRALDLLVEGQDRADPERRPVLLAVEVSRTIEARDVERALARAKILERAGYRAPGGRRPAGGRPGEAAGGRGGGAGADGGDRGGVTGRLPHLHVHGR
ncbi:hypothetical protein O0235_02080 [Tepidiforma flava]|uniref:Chromosome partition protein Smc n=1 Tax=Tepidiforma flava TaxID=3004094 RepID=A0ABY7M799_9CHLR|nr:hypothetical protein [Tepidiforma flava]WBL36383.1 hypothetical protein O0235_02080 [Tepidiforma flava]